MPVRAKARLVAVCIFLVAGAIAAAASIRRDLATPVDLAPVDYVQSETCRRCHEEHYQSWRRTFHRTMTQEAGPEAVLGDFENAVYTYDGVTSRFTRSGDDYYIETLGPEGRLERFRVVRTVGSRRIQQYVVKVGDRIRATCSVVAVTPHATGTQMVMSYVIEIEDEAKPACVAETVVLLLD